MAEKPRALTAHEAAVARHRPKAQVVNALRAFIGKAGRSRTSWTSK